MTDTDLSPSVGDKAEAFYDRRNDNSYTVYMSGLSDIVNNTIMINPLWKLAGQESQWSRRDNSSLTAVQTLEPLCSSIPDSEV